MRRQFLCSLVLISIATGFVGSRPVTAQVELTRGPYLQSVLTDRAEILWRTSAPSLGRVEVTAENGETITRAEASEETLHRLGFSDLEPGTLHAYKVFDGDTVLAEGERFEFRTAPLPGQRPVRFSVIGDSGEGDKNQHAVTRLVEAFCPDVFLHTGDIMYVPPPSIRSSFGNMLRSFRALRSMSRAAIILFRPSIATGRSFSRFHR